MCDVPGTVLPSSARHSLSVPGKEGGGTPVDFINTPGVFHPPPHPQSLQAMFHLGLDSGTERGYYWEKG